MPPKSVIIVGGGAAVWLTASMLARALSQSQWTLTVVEMGNTADSLGLPLGADYLSPRALEQLATLGYEEAALLARTHGTVALGNAFSDWGSTGTSFQPYAAAGVPIGPVAFHQLAARLRMAGKPINFSNYALGALCAQANRFAPPHSDDRGVLSTLVYGQHVESSAFISLLRADALERGVQLAVGGVARVVRHVDELIDHVLTDHGESISGDLFLDCTGPSALLCADAPRNLWTQWLPCNRIMISQKPNDDAPACYVHIAAHAAGWQRFTALRGKVEEVFAFNDEAMGTDAPESAIVFTPSRRVAPWRGNCLAIGGAAAVVDPLMNPQLELAVAAVTRLIGLLPTKFDCIAEAREYNRQTAAELDSVRDVAAAAYALNTRPEHFWAACRAPPLPERLAYKIALYQNGGRIALYDDEIYGEGDWVGLFEALGARAQRYDAQANALNLAEVEAHFARIRQVMLGAVGKLPPHDAYLQSLAR